MRDKRGREENEERRAPLVDGGGDGGGDGRNEPRRVALSLASRGQPSRLNVRVLLEEEREESP